MELLLILDTFVIPGVAVLLPFVILAVHLISKRVRISLSKQKILLFSGVWIGLSLAIFALMLYLTGDLATFFYLEPGYYRFEGGFQINFNHKIGLTFRYNPGFTLLAVSILSALLYSTLLVLPPVCTIVPTEVATSGSVAGTSASISSGVTSAVSAVASTAVCCSTSIASVLAPSLVTILGPFVPVLLYFSLALLIYSFVRIVLPRFPTT